MMHSKDAISLLDMVEIHAQRIFMALINLSSLSTLFATATAFAEDSSKRSHIKTNSSTNINITVPAIRLSIENLIEFAENMELQATSASLKRLHDQLNECGSMESKLFSNMVDQITSRMRDELAVRFLVGLDIKEHRIYELSSNYFGEEVSRNFPSLHYDIEEAAKCLALGRSTASVFHFIRCLEAGFTAIWRCLGISDPVSGFERNWSNRLKKVQDQIEIRWPKSTGRMTVDARFFDEILGSLIAMQNPYRNNTMHFDAKYTQEEAEHIALLVKGIMKKISSRMDEDGLPPA